jgi:hypothetical protein
VPPTQAPLQNIGEVGVNTTADTINRLSVAAEATLLTHAGAGHQLKVNKAVASDTASLLFQTGSPARAEMGTTGTDDFAIKVSPDGVVYEEAVVTACIKLDAGDTVELFALFSNSDGYIEADQNYFHGHQIG